MMLLSQFTYAVTYTTVQDGDWTSSTTWLNGNVPNTNNTISSSTTINIHHVINYNTGNPIKNEGVIRIEPDANGSIANLEIPTNINIENFSSGEMYILNAALTQNRFVGGGNSGTKQSGTWKNIGGYVKVISSYIEVAQDWVNESDGVRIFKNGCVYTGQNFSSSGSDTKDTLINVTISIGWHGSGNFELSDARMIVSGLKIQNAGTSGDIKFDSGYLGGDITYISMTNHETNQVCSGKLFASSSLNVVGSIDLDAYYTESASDYEPNGKFSGNQTRTNALLNTYFPGTCVSVEEFTFYADMEVTKTVNNSAAQAGDTVIFTIVATNNGGSEASGVMVSDTLPAGYNLISASATSGTWSAPEWDLGTMANGSSETLTLEVKVTNTDAHVNTAYVSANEEDTIPSNNSDNASIQLPDTDVDSVKDIVDIDDDNDGIPDIVEGGGVDPSADADGDYILNFEDPSYPGFVDSNSDGINDNFDFDLDGIPNHLDLDSDNDGIPDIIEAGGTDSNNDGLVDNYTDTDNDGLDDAYDADNGGTVIPNEDFDGDDNKNFLDLDSDGDGIIDTREAGITDSDNDGIADGTLGEDGWSDLVDALPSLSLTNSDSHGSPDYLDIDSDNDGVVDNIEGQSTSGYTAPTGTDSDGDGIDDAYDNDSGNFGGQSNNGITPVNTDGTDTPDYIDLNSDNDANDDRIEAWDTNGNGEIDGGEVAYIGLTDADGDGLFDEYDSDDANVNPTNASTPGSYPDEDSPGDDRDWREDNGDGGSPLPIELLSFDLSLVDDTRVELTWETAVELNNQYFTISHSTNGVDFEFLTQVEGAGTSNYSNRYFTFDNSPVSGTNYYMLSQTDFDGTTQIVAIKAIEVVGKGDLEINSWTTSGGVVELSFTSTSDMPNVLIQLFTANGKLIYNEVTNATEGNNQLSVNDLRLSQGVYIIRLMSQNAVANKKIFIQQ
jgi:uncharacterized repeat protein (TIGR01451 family)